MRLIEVLNKEGTEDFDCSSLAGWIDTVGWIGVGGGE